MHDRKSRQFIRYSKNEYKGLLKGCVILTHNIALVEHSREAVILESWITLPFRDFDREKVFSAGP